MRSFGKQSTAAVLLVALVGAWAPSSHAQTAAGARYESLHEQELRVSRSPGALADDLRFVINNYWNFVRRYPTSGYADNALWQAANLSMEVFGRFSEDRDQYRAIQLFQWLRDQYPQSSLAKKATPHLEQLAVAQLKPETAQQARQPSRPNGTETIIRAVQREVLPEVVRVTIELDREVPFYQERLDGPSRLFFDLRGTKTVPALVDAALRYDADIVRDIRLGRHPNNTTRIVLDLENVGRYSVFTLYNPYRIVIDSERAAPAPLILPAASLDEPEMIPASREPREAIAADMETMGTQHVASAGPIAHAPALSAPRVPIASIPRASAPPGITVPNTTAALDAPVSAPIAPAAGKPVAPSANSGGKFSVARQLGLGVSRVVIDAGHGGHDPGASAFGVSEAELVLDLTLRLEKLLLEQPGMEVVLTRRTNDYLTLEERTEIANRESADLFLSIHANASANATARGVETYFLNFALNPQAEAVAARENAASGRTMNSLPDIIKAITLNSKLNESRDFAASIQRGLVRGLRQTNRNVKDLGVKQAPFMVLIGASMPSVLAEISFVTNRQEARLLTTPRYRQKIAESLLAGILRYQQSLKKVQTASVK